MTPATPTIAIVGRPNVGKSTLFNRLTGRRSALVSDIPGLTRDRREGEMEISGRRVKVVDTAGLEEAPPGTIAARMRQQSEIAIRSADLVLFVIDARDGITPADKAFARLVRNSGRPAVLVANKCEGRRGVDGFYEAFELGLGDPVAISAEHGEGIGELIEEIGAALGLGEAKSDEPGAIAEPAARHPLRVAVIGRPNVGKSTLVNALLGQERMLTGPEPGLTRDAIAIDLEWSGRKVRLFDTAGLRRKAKVTEAVEKLATSDTIRAIRFAEVVVLLIDATHPFEHQDLALGDFVTEEGRALVIAANKWDLVEDKQKTLRALREMAAERLAQVPGVPLVAVSAQAERGLNQLMSAVEEAYEIWNKRVPTPELNRWLREAVDRHPPPAAKGRAVKLRFITQPSARPPTFVVFTPRPQSVPKAYVRYLVNSLRETFGLPGTPVRLVLRRGDNPYAAR
jgi:GTP-binding protein